MATLHLVSTPIGNLDDLTPRAADVLRASARILCEDTRRTRILTQRVGATAPLVSLHGHNEQSRIPAILAWLDAGEDLALVSDAGTPLVSDPGERLVAAVVEAGHRVVALPGPSAVLTALVASGLPTERFSFLGFPERKGSARRELLERVAGSTETVVLFESPARTARLLADLAEACGPSRHGAVARELTKLHEEVRRGTLRDLALYYEENPARGEVTVVVAPANGSGEDGVVKEAEAEALARRLLADGARPSAVAKELSARLDLPRNEAYRIVHEIAESDTEA